MVVDLYTLFQKPPEDHTSLRQFYTPPDVYASFLSRPSLLRKVISQWEGIGWVKALEFETQFPTTAHLLQAIVSGDTKVLMTVDGIGKVLAEHIIEEASR